MWLKQEIAAPASRRVLGAADLNKGEGRKSEDALRVSPDAQSGVRCRFDLSGVGRWKQRRDEQVVLDAMFLEQLAE
jgi:hypothetical protein